MPETAQPFKTPEEFEDLLEGRIAENPAISYRERILLRAFAKWARHSREQFVAGKRCLSAAMSTLSENMRYVHEYRDNDAKTLGSLDAVEVALTVPGLTDSGIEIQRQIIVGPRGTIERLAAELDRLVERFCSGDAVRPTDADAPTNAVG